jgi:hypothetical protein
VEDFKKNLTVTISGRTFMSMQVFLKKHGFVETDDVSRFIEDALTWRILDRESAFRRKSAVAAFKIFEDIQIEDETQKAQEDQQPRVAST